MIDYEKMLHDNILEWYRNTDSFSSEQYNCYMENFYDSLISTLINKVKKDSGNFKHLDNIQQVKKDISAETRKQYRIIISYCKETERNNIKEALNRYNFLHFLKFTIRILDLDDDYENKVNKCKKYFSNKQYLKVVEHLYHKNEVPYNELILSFDSDCKLPIKTNNVDEIIVVKQKDDYPVYSLSPIGKNLYAFFTMKNIKIHNLDANYNEGKVTEVLEYLIQYITTQQELKNSIKKPVLHSSSANNNLNRLLSLLENSNNFTSSSIQRVSDYKDESYNWKGGENHWNRF